MGLVMDDYDKYRGKCKEMAEEAVKNDPTLTLVRGFYYDPCWGTQPHWWTVRKDGTIYDPTALQFPSKGKGEYEPFNGMVNCAECGKEVAETEARIGGNGHYAFCSSRCEMIFVGLGEFIR